MRKKLLQSAGVLLTSAALLSTTLVGCSSQGASSNAKSQNQVTLTIETSQEMKTNNPYDLYQPNIDAFEKKYPNIKVKLLLDPDAQAQSILQTKLAAGQSSDIVIYSKVSAENELGVQKNFLDLSKEPWVSNLTNPSAIKAPDGKIYGFTMKNMVGGMGIVYNEDIFKQLNISIPKTYDEFVAACNKIKANGITPIYAPFKDVWTFQMWTTSAWGYYVAKSQPNLWNKLNSHKIKWTDVPAFKDSLTKMYNLYKDGYMQSSLLSDDYNSVPQAFESKKYAMMMGADVTATDLIAKIPDTHFGLFPLPMFDGESDYLTIAQLDGVFFIPKNAKHQQEAKEFLNFMAQPKQLNAAQKAKSFAPSIKGAAEPHFNAFEQEIYTKYNKPGKTVVEMNANMKVDLTDLWKGYQDMFAGQKAPSKVLQDWDVKFDQLMNSKGISGF